MTKRPSAFPPEDYWLIVPVLALVAIGLTLIYSATGIASKKPELQYYYLVRQCLHAGVGIVGFFFFRFLMPIRRLRQLTYPVLLSAFGLLVAVLFIGHGGAESGADRWLAVGPVNFQPAELMKYAFVLYMAYSMEKKDGRMGDFSIGILPHLVVFLLAATLVYQQPDLGSILVIAGIIWLMLLLGGASSWHLVVPIPVAIVATVIAVCLAPYRVKRITGFLHPWANRFDEGYQVVQSLIAYGSGGLTGLGPGNGKMKLGHVPEIHTDFILAVMGEEYGFLGVAGIIVLFAIVVFKAFSIGEKARANFDRYLAWGIAITIMLHAILNMAVSLSLAPAKGLALPFMSYGGTSLVLNMCAIGILANVAATSRRTA